MIAIGSDIVEIARLQSVFERQGEKFVKRILTDTEYALFQVKTDPLRYLAKRFAGKEAVVKALGTGIGNGVSWQDIEIANNVFGAPIVQLRAGAQQQLSQLGGTNMLLTLSDEQHYAIAFAAIV